ncbi:hypothetical protein ACFL2B_00335 [Patescibacteria group bacterium]
MPRESEGAPGPDFEKMERPQKLEGKREIENADVADGFLSRYPDVTKALTLVRDFHKNKESYQKFQDKFGTQRDETLSRGLLKKKRDFAEMRDSYEVMGLKVEKPPKKSMIGWLKKKLPFFNLSKEISEEDIYKRVRNDVEQIKIALGEINEGQISAYRESHQKFKIQEEGNKLKNLTDKFQGMDNNMEAKQTKADDLYEKLTGKKPNKLKQEKAADFTKDEREQIAIRAKEQVRKQVEPEFQMLEAALRDRGYSGYRGEFKYLIGNWYNKMGRIGLQKEQAERNIQQALRTGNVKQFFANTTEYVKARSQNYSERINYYGIKSLIDKEIKEVEKLPMKKAEGKKRPEPITVEEIVSKPYEEPVQTEVDKQAAGIEKTFEQQKINLVKGLNEVHTTQRIVSRLGGEAADPVSQQKRRDEVSKTLAKINEALKPPDSELLIPEKAFNDFSDSAERLNEVDEELVPVADLGDQVTQQEIESGEESNQPYEVIEMKISEPKADFDTLFQNIDKGLQSGDIKKATENIHASMDWINSEINEDLPVPTLRVFKAAMIKLKQSALVGFMQSSGKDSLILMKEREAIVDKIKEINKQIKTAA